MAKPLHQRTPGADIKQVKGKKIAPHRPQKDCGPHHKAGEGAEGSQSHRQRKDGERAVDQNGDQDMQRVVPLQFSVVFFKIFGQVLFGEQGVQQIIGRAVHGIHP